MRIVNDMGLPIPIIRAIEADDYTAGSSDISVTSLVGPALIRHLQIKHKDDLEEKASTRLFSLMGKMMHKILETAAGSEDLAHLIIEKRLYAEVDGWKVGGQIDILDPVKKEIHDYKVCSFWTAIFGAKDEWICQQNIYRYLAVKNGYEIDRLKIAALFRDWSFEQVGKKRDYPEAPMQLIELPVWSMDKTERYIKDRIKEHKKEKPPLCTPDERWQRVEGYAVMKEGRKSALRVLDSQTAAAEWIGLHADPGELSKLKIERRESLPKRCMRYCNVAKFCSYGRRYQQ